MSYNNNKVLLHRNTNNKTVLHRNNNNHRTEIYVTLTVIATIVICVFIFIFIVISITIEEARYNDNIDSNPNDIRTRENVWYNNIISRYLNLPPILTDAEWQNVRTQIKPLTDSNADLIKFANIIGLTTVTTENNVTVGYVLQFIQSQIFFNKLIDNLYN